MVTNFQENPKSYDYLFFSVASCSVSRGGFRGGVAHLASHEPPFLESFQQLLEPAAEAMEYLLTLNVRLKYDL